MPQLTLVPYGNSAALVLSPEILASLGLAIGDSVEVALSDRQLILRPTDDAARRQQMAAIV